MLGMCSVLLNILQGVQLHRWPADDINASLVLDDFQFLHHFSALSMEKHRL